MIYFHISGKYNIQTLDCNTCVKFLGEVSMLKQNNKVNEKWVKDVWRYVENNFQTSLETVKHLYIVPIKGSSTPLRKISDCLVNIIGIGNEELWTEIFALFNIFVVKDNLLQHSLMKPGNSYVWSAVKDRLNVLGKQIPDVVEIFNSESSSQSKEELKKYFADNNGNLTPSLLEYIKELKIFRRHSSVNESDGYTSIKACKTIFVADKDFPVPFTQNMIVTFSKRESELVSKLSNVKEDLSNLVSKALIKLTREPSWLPMKLKRQLCCYILEKKQKITNWKNIISVMKSIKWIRNRNGEYTACANLYDPTDKLLETVFDSQKFPCAEDVKLVHQIGHLTRKDDCFLRDIETVCKKIHEMQGKSEEREFMAKSNALLKIMEGNYEMVDHMSGYKIWPYEKKKFRWYPNSLSWFKTVGLVELNLLQSRKSANLIGSVMPVATRECNKLLNSLKHASPFDKKVLEHFRNVVRSYIRSEHLQYMTIMDSIYQHFEQSGCLDVAKCEEFILTEYGFKDVSSIYIEREIKRDIDTTPYLLPLPVELHKFKKFFEKCQCYPSQTPESLLEVLRKLNEKHRGNFDVDEVKTDLYLIVKILKSLSRLKQISDEKPLNIPVQSHDQRRIIFKPANDCVYADTDWFSSKFAEEENLNFVHPEIRKDVARKLGVRSLKEYTLADAEEMFEEFGQSEKLTLRLKSLLEGYKDGLSVPKELIQNADDAGAKVVKFLYDERENNQARSSLIDPNMKSLQGPALWAYNDAEFTDEDFKNIQKLSAATKKEDSTKIGTFGVGFNAVYNLTDVPSFVSGGSLVYLDPHEVYLGEALKSNRRSPGIKLQLRNKIMMEKMRDQFLPYENVFGFRRSSFLQGGTYHGTLFRLPLRTRSQAMKSEICQKEYSTYEMEKLIDLINKAAGNLLLFTQNVQELHFYRLKNTSRSPGEDMKCILIVKKTTQMPMDRTILQQVTQQLKLTNILNPYQYLQHQKISVWNAPSVSQSVHWLLSWSGGDGESLVLWKNRKSDGALPLACVAVPMTGNETNSLCRGLSCLPEGFYHIGNLFCFLPMPVVTGLPFHINGNFSISTDRQHVLVTSSDEKEDSKHVIWNKCLIKDAVLNALIALLLRLCPKVNVEKMHMYYSLWPTNVNGIWKILGEEFYRKITENTLLEVFFTSNGWKAFHQCKFLHPNLQGDKHLKEIALTVISKFEEKSSFICDLPCELFENIKTCCKKKQIVTRQIFACEYFLRNIGSIECRNYDYALKCILLWEDDSIKTSLMKTPCIPTRPNGRKRFPNNLVDPDESVSKLFSEIDEVFPKDAYLERKKTRKNLMKLGMMTDTVSVDILLEQTKGVQNLDGKCRKCAYDRIEHILRFCKSINLSETDIELWHNIAFLPAEQKPEDWQYSWYLSKILNDQYGKKLCGMHKFCTMPLTMYFCPCDLFFSAEQNFVSSNHLILGLSVRQQEEHYTLLKSFGVKNFGQVTLEMLSSQLSDVMQHEYLHENTMDLCRTLYCAFDHKLKERSSIKKTVLADLSGKRCIFIGDKFVHPSRVVFSLKFDCEPFLFHLKGRDLGRYKYFLKAVGVQQNFTEDELITVLREVQKKNGENGLSRDSLHAVCQIAMLLESISNSTISYQLHDQLFLPDHRGIMRKACDLCQNDFDWISESPNMTFLHPDITKSVAEFARIKSKREQDLWASSSEIGFDFGQSEDLKSRIKSLLEGYPEISILKELLQNADDAGSTELHFILDSRQHKIDKLFSESWAELQGPALCVYNDSVFTEKDIQGIQNLGIGSKTSDSTKTGRYGVGFNAVYRLTDVPCFLTRTDDENSLCVLDPHCKYIPHATIQKPGRMFKDACNYLHKNYPDVLSCFLTNERIWEKRKGTLFRFPLRRHDSEISKKCSPKDIEEMLQTFKAEMGENMLFLDNVRKIQISKIERHGKVKSEFFVEVKNSTDNDIDPRNAKKRLAKNPLDFESNLSYNLELKYNGAYAEKWLIVQQYGLQSGNNAIGELSSKLGLLPVVGVAIPRSQSYRDLSCKAFCTLPLPVETGIPMHVHGQFALQHDTRTNIFWPDLDSYWDERYRWNKCLIECVAVPVYAKTLEILKDEICKYGNYETNRMGCFHRLFPDIPQMKEIFRYLALCFYKHAASSNLEIFPVIQNTEKNLTCRWVAIQSDVYFDDLDKHFKHIFPPKNDTDRKFQEEAAKFANLLRNFGIKLLNSPLWIHNSMEMAKISVKKISPRSVLIFFQNFEDVDCESGRYHLHIDVDIYKTLLKSVHNVIETLEFCLHDKSLKSDEFENVPLLVTADGYLRKFTTRKMIYLTRLSDYISIFPRSQYQLLHPNLKTIVWNHRSMFEPFIKYIHLDVLAELLKENFSSEMQGCKTTVHEVDFPSQRWLQLFWCFVGKLYKKFRYQEKGDIKTFVDEMKLHIKEWALVPVMSPNQLESKVLYPIQDGKTIFKLINEVQSDVDNDAGKVTQAMKRMCLPYLDMTEITMPTKKTDHKMTNRNWEFEDASLVLSHLVATADNAHDILQCIVSNIHQLRNRSESEILMEYFESNLSILKCHQDTKKHVKVLPFYENVLGDYQTLDANLNTVVVLPSGIPEDGLDKLGSVCGIQFLKHKNYTEVYRFAGCRIVDVVELYKDYILPNFNHLPERDIFIHIVKLKDDVQLTPGIIDLLKQTAFLVKNECRQRACQFYNPQIALYSSLCQENDILPAPFSEEKWIPFLILCGLKNEVTKEIFLEFASRVEEKEKTCGMCTTVERCSTILIEILKSERMFNMCQQFMNRIKDIHFILPHRVDDRLRMIHHQFADNQLLNFADSELVKNEELVWTNCGILNKTACSVVDDQGVWQIFGHDEKPPEGKVVQHIKLLCSNLTTDQTVKLDVNQEIDHKLRSVFQTIYSYLESSSNGIIELLRDTSFIHIIERKAFATPNKVVINMEDNNEIPPYLYKASTYFGQFHSVFQKFGSAEKLYSNHCADVLGAIFKETEGDITDPNERKNTIKAVEILFEKLKQEASDVQLKSQIYFPSREHKLMPSTDLVVVDDRVLEKRVNKGKPELNYFIGFNELKMESVRDPVKTICLIPVEYRPKLLTKMVTEEISVECKSQKCRGDKAKYLQNFLCCEEFVRAAIRLVRHERYKEDKTCGAEEENHIREALSKLRIFEVDNLTTVLKLNSEIIKNTEMKRILSYVSDEENPDMLYIYLNSEKRLENTKWIESIADELTHVINFVLKSELNESCLHLAHILHFIENPTSIESYLDSKQIISVEDTFPNSVPFIPELGSEIPVSLHHLLQNSFESLERNEYVGYEQFDLLVDGDSDPENSIPVFLFAQVEVDETKETKNVWNKRFKINIGSENPVTVSATRIYKFVRKPKRSKLLEIVVYAQSTSNECSHPPRSERGRNLKEEKGLIKNIMKDSVDKPHNEQKRIWKRLLLQYHPDKHMENKEFYTKLTQYINSLIQRINDGRTLNYDSDDDVDGGSGFRRPHKHYHPFRPPPRHGFNFWSFYEHCFNRGKSYAEEESSYTPPPEDQGYFREFRRRGTQPGQADRWYRQAKYDLAATQCCEGLDNAHNWICFKCHQVGSSIFNSINSFVCFKKNPHRIDCKQ